MTAKEEQPLPSAAAAPPASTYCRKKKTDDATFFKDVKDHFDGFVNASMEDHKNCFKNTMNKMFAMTKVAALRESQSKEVHSSLPFQATVSTPNTSNGVATESEQSLPTTVAPASSYCYKRKNESATFFKKLNDRADEFLSASMEDHKNCYKNTINKMLGFTKDVALQDSQSHEVQSSEPLQTTASE